MANQAAAQQQQVVGQQQQQREQTVGSPSSQMRSFKQELSHQPPQSPSYLSNGSIASIMSNVGSHYPHLTAIPVSQMPRKSPSLPAAPLTPTHTVHAPTALRPEEVIKVETTIDHETDDMKPTDLSTNGERKYMDTSNDCFP